MAHFETAQKKIFKAEFNDNPDLFLHHNSGEQGWTLGGIYQKVNPSLNWDFVSSLVVLCETDIKRASRMLYYDTKTMKAVGDIFKSNYWDILMLDRVISQKIAEEIYLMAVVGGVKTGAKIAQRLIGVNADGIVGNQTLTALNQFNENRFDVEFDEAEIRHFQTIVNRNPSKYERFMRGWTKRARMV